MKNYKVLFADLDGTLISTITGNSFPKGIWDMKFKFSILNAIKTLKPKYLFIVTNQAGISEGLVNQYSFEIKMEYIVRSIQEYLKTDTIIRYCYCASNDDNNIYRKPNTGMLSHCLNTFVNGERFANDELLMICDASSKKSGFSDSDKKCAENFGIDYLDIKTFVSLNK